MFLSENPHDRPADFDKKSEGLKDMRAGLPRSYRMAIDAIRSVLKGTDLNNTRENHYKGWEDIDLQDLLTELGEAK